MSTVHNHHAGSIVFVDRHRIEPGKTLNVTDEEAQHIDSVLKQTSNRNVVKLLPEESPVTADSFEVTKLNKEELVTPANTPVAVKVEDTPIAREVLEEQDIPKELSSKEEQPETAETTETTETTTDANSDNMDSDNIDIDKKAQE